jgi:hypothetical protein
MKTLPRGLVVCIAVALAPTALAQTAEQNNTVAARAFIESEGVSDLFEAVEDENITVRHLASRLICHFFGGETTKRLAVFSGQPRGDDVGCIRDHEHQAITLYATRYAPAITAEQAMADAVAGIRHRFTDARPTPALLHMTSDNLPTPLVRHFLITLNGEQWITSALVAQNGDWIIKVRCTERALDQDALLRSQLEANAVMMSALLEIRS